MRLPASISRMIAGAVGLILIAVSLGACSTGDDLGTVLARSTISAELGGTVGAPNGVQLTVPAGVLARDSEAQIIEVGAHEYDIHINGEWTGQVGVTVPLSGDENAVVHRVGDTWVVEGADYGESTVWVSQLSWFSDLLSKAKDVLCLKFSIKKFLNCLALKGIKYINGELAQWIAEKMDNSCLLNMVLDAPDPLAIALDQFWEGPCVATAGAPAVPETEQPAPTEPAPETQAPEEQTQPAPAPAPPAPAAPPPPPSGYVADGGYLGYAKNSKNPSDPNFYYWHYLAICTSNLAPGDYTLKFSNDAVSNYHTMTLNLPANGCVSTNQQGGTTTSGGLSNDWFVIEVVGQFTTARYQPWT